MLDAQEKAHYGQVMKLGRVVEAKAKVTTYFEASPFQAAIVAKATLKRNMTNHTSSYISVLPGGGKTAIVCWCAKVIEDRDPG